MARRICWSSQEGRRTVVGTFPIGIDFEAFERDAKRPEIAAHAADIRKRVSDDVLVLGVDRLDYTKGIPERLKSFRLLLRRFPEMRGHITLVQVVVPSREEIPNYKHLRREVELLVSQINGEFTEPGWVPVHYIHRNLGRDELLAYYRAADIGLVTPLKDGMNLVAKEFCAAQIDERGVLIVSEFAGAGPELRSGAIIVNPNDFAEVAQALYDAAHMSADDKRCRMRLLRQIVKDHNVHRWIRSFLQAIPEPVPRQKAVRAEIRGSRPPNRRNDRKETCRAWPWWLPLSRPPVVRAMRWARMPNFACWAAPQAKTRNLNAATMLYRLAHRTPGLSAQPAISDPSRQAAAVHRLSHPGSRVPVAYVPVEIRLAAGNDYFRCTCRDR